jgi:two-component system cell cycle sensor histidine kinase PleC
MEKQLVNAVGLEENMSYLIFNHEGKVLVTTRGEFIINKMGRLINKFLNSKDKKELISITPLPLFGSSKNLYVKKLKGLDDYYIAVASQESLWGKTLFMSLKKTFYNLSLVISLCIVIFIFVNKFIVHPVLRLSKAAEKISKNERYVEIEEHQSREILFLAEGLKKVILQKAELVEANEKLEFLLKKLEAMNKTKLDFIRNIQHELRTPLNHIIGGCDVLNSQFAGPLVPEYIEYIKIIYQSGRDLLSKINNIIAVADFESGNVRLSETKSSVNEIINSALNMLLPKIKQHKLNLKLDIQLNLPYIYVDAEKIKTAIFNFINNSITFNKPDGTITITANQSLSGIVIEIADNGQGIPQEDLNKITEMFATTGDVLTKVKSGLGLGLTIAQSILDLHDIKMYIDSQVGEGTSVKIFIPNIRLKSRQTSDNI